MVDVLIILVVLSIIFAALGKGEGSEDFSDLPEAQRNLVKNGVKSANFYRAANAKEEQMRREKVNEELLMKQAKKIAEEIVSKQRFSQKNVNKKTKTSKNTKTKKPISKKKAS